MRPLTLVVLAASVLAGCSLFGSDVERLTGTTLFRTDSLATTDSTFARSLWLVTSAGEEEAFRVRYGIAEPFPATDYATSSLVALVERTTAPNASVLIQSVELIGDDRVLVVYESSEVVVRSGPVRYPLHIVRIRRIEDLARRSVESRGTGSFTPR